MRRILLAASLFASLSLSATTFANTVDVCRMIPGAWHGTFTLKDQARCERFGGCTHEIFAYATKLSDTQYTVDIKPSVGNGGLIPMTCENGKITADANPGNTVKLECSNQGTCVVHYEDPGLTSVMINVR